jgi:hypothetical protein
MNASVSHHASNFIKGEHDFKFGIEYEHSDANRTETYTGGIYYLDYYGAPYYRYLWEGYDSFGRIRRTSAFAQDSWRITDKVTANIGVRWDHNHAFLHEAPQFAYTTSPVAPRIGMVYDIKGNQSTVIKAHYGKYYEGAITFYIDGIDDFGDYTTQYFDGSDWVVTDFTPGTSAYVIDPNLKQPYTNQFTIGVDQQFKSGWNLSAHYIYRSDHDLIEDTNSTGEFAPFDFINPLTGEHMTLFNQTNPDVPRSLFVTNQDRLFRNYHGVEIYGGKRFSNKFSMTGSLVLSRARSNLGNTDSESNGFSTVFDDPNLFINFEGKPTHDPTVEIKMTGIYELPWHILSSFYYRHFSGDTWAATYRLPRSLIDQSYRVTIFLEPRGNQRLPARNVVDFRIEKGFPIAEGQLKFTLDVFNLFNTGYVLDVEERFDRGTFGEPADLSAPRQVRLGIRYQF